jgi:hypothetical protein
MVVVNGLYITIGYALANSHKCTLETICGKINCKHVSNEATFPSTCVTLGMLFSKLIQILQTHLISSLWRRKYCDYILNKLTVSSVGVTRQKQRPRVFNKNLAEDLGYALT